MQQVLSAFKALSDRNRLRIVQALTGYDELCACQITELLDVTGATASRHLAVLVQGGLLESRKEGRWVHYRLNRRTFQDGPLHPLLVWVQEQLDTAPEIRKDRRKLEKVISARKVCPV